MGFKWFVDGLVDGSLGFVGEESAGASLLKRDGTVWTTDKDGIVLGLLAAEITARTGKNPAVIYDEIARDLGTSHYARIDAAAERGAEGGARAGSIRRRSGSRELAGEPVGDTLVAAPGNGAALGGVKVVAENGWFAARPSGTEDVYKIYAESFRSAAHLAEIQGQAQTAISALFASQGAA